MQLDVGGVLYATSVGALRARSGGLPVRHAPVRALEQACREHRQWLPVCVCGPWRRGTQAGFRSRCLTPVPILPRRYLEACLALAELHHQADCPEAGRQLLAEVDQALAAHLLTLPDDNADQVGHAARIRAAGGQLTLLRHQGAAPPHPSPLPPPAAGPAGRPVPAQQPGTAPPPHGP